MVSLRGWVRLAPPFFVPHILVHTCEPQEFYMKLTPIEIAEFFVVGERYSVFSHHRGRYMEERTINRGRYMEERTIISIEHGEQASSVRYANPDGTRSTLVISNEHRELRLTDVVALSQTKMTLRSLTGSMFTYQIIPRRP